MSGMREEIDYVTSLQIFNNSKYCDNQKTNSLSTLKYNKFTNIFYEVKPFYGKMEPYF